MSIFNLTANSSSVRSPAFKFDHMNQNQGRAFGPVLGLFLMNLLTKAVTAKYDSYYPFQVNYDYSPWLPSYTPPPLNYLPPPNDAPPSYFTDWYPIKNPYDFDHFAYPTLTTTAAPIAAAPLLPNGQVSEYDDYEYDSRTQDPKNYDTLLPAESNNIHKQSVFEDLKTTKAPEHKIVFPSDEISPVKDPKTISLKDQKNNSLEEHTRTKGRKTLPKKENIIPTTISSEEDKTIPETGNIPPPDTTTISATTSTSIPVTTLLMTLTTDEPIAASSNMKVRRHPTQKYKRKGPTRSDRYPQKRRRTTTPAPEYYDSYEDEYTERYQPNRKRRPQYPSSESYYDDNNSDYYDSVETTTRFYKKQKRRPTRKVNKVNKNQNRNDESFEIETNTQRYNPINPNTEIVIVRQAAATTTAATTSTTTSGSTTPEPTTIITNSTSTPATTTETSNNTIGYGPSNGNEQVAFTYGPPADNYQYQVPYVDWYTHEATKNAIVKRVRDIVDTRL